MLGEKAGHIWLKTQHYAAYNQTVLDENIFSFVKYIISETNVYYHHVTKTDGQSITEVLPC